MAFTKMITRGDGKKAVEVFIKGEELLKVLRQQDIHVADLDTEERYCLTFTHSDLEQYD